MRVALYARVSTRDQDCEMQLADLRRMAQARGARIVEEYADRGVSGTRDSRPQLDKLMRDARRRRFDAVWVWRFDRFARSLRHLVAALDEFKALQIDFASHQEAVDTSTPAGRMLFQVIGAMAEFEREIIRERVVAGIERAKRRGHRLGRPRVAVDVVGALALRASGMSFREIASRMGVSVGKVHQAIGGEATRA
jgi:DNA invertase Pin-like site-specific DNA recombinase